MDVINEVIHGTDHVGSYIDDVIVFDVHLSLHVPYMTELVLSFQKHNPKLFPSNGTICTTNADFLGHNVSHAGVMPNAIKIEVPTKMPKPKDLKQARSLFVRYGKAPTPPSEK